MKSIFDDDLDLEDGFNNEARLLFEVGEGLLAEVIILVTAEAADLAMDTVMGEGTIILEAVVASRILLRAIKKRIIAYFLGKPQSNSDGLDSFFCEIRGMKSNFSRKTTSPVKLTIYLVFFAKLHTKFVENIKVRFHHYALGG